MGWALGGMLADLDEAVTAEDVLPGRLPRTRSLPAPPPVRLAFDAAGTERDPGFRIALGREAFLREALGGAEAG